MELSGDKINLTKALDLIVAELYRANRKFPLFSSKHEGHAVIREEFDEMWDEVKDKNHTNSVLQKECIQLAAMCIKFLISDIYEGEK